MSSLLSATGVVERASSFLAGRVSRRSFMVRSAFAGSALAVAGADFALRPGTAYAAICRCAQAGCSCGSTCCDGYTEFCCTLNGGYNYCPAGSIIGGWWRADGSAYCTGPRYYMDCNALCSCTDGCGGGWPFCDTGCDGLDCGCAGGNCANWATGCFQFRYGQCNQDVACMGRILCRVVSCVPPWEFDTTCTTTNAQDDNTANMHRPCDGGTPYPCDSAATQCDVVAMAATPDGGGYFIVTGFGKLFTYGDATNFGDMSSESLYRPVVDMARTPTGRGYWFVASDGGIFAFGDATFHGSMGGRSLVAPMVGMAATPTGLGYWTVAADGGIFSFGDAVFHGSMGGQSLAHPMVGITATPTGRGYWTVAADGGIFAFGDALFHGSMGGQSLVRQMVGMACTPTGSYWTV
ncbi:MAG TPA: hypothetical protein VE991_04745, partial [Acidimicrobiales bacterium]|nr:hypothetical protein [Acidimicrobiales bacterium]